MNRSLPPLLLLTALVVAIYGLVGSLTSNTSTPPPPAITPGSPAPPAAFPAAQVPLPATDKIISEDQLATGEGPEFLLTVQAPVGFGAGALNDVASVLTAAGYKIQESAVIPQAGVIVASTNQWTVIASFNPEIDISAKVPSGSVVLRVVVGPGVPTQRTVAAGVGSLKPAWDAAFQRDPSTKLGVNDYLPVLAGGVDAFTGVTFDATSQRVTSYTENLAQAETVSQVVAHVKSAIPADSRLTSNAPDDPCQQLQFQSKELLSELPANQGLIVVKLYSADTNYDPAAITRVTFETWGEPGYIGEC